MTVLNTSLVSFDYMYCTSSDAVHAFSNVKTDARCTCLCLCYAKTGIQKRATELAACKLLVAGTLESSCAFLNVMVIVIGSVMMMMTARSSQNTK